MTKRQRRLRRQRWMQAGRRSVRQAERRARERHRREISKLIDEVWRGLAFGLMSSPAFEWRPPPIPPMAMGLGWIFKFPPA